MIITRLPLPDSDATAGAAPAAVVSDTVLHFTPRSEVAGAVAAAAAAEKDDEADVVATRCADWYRLLSRPGALLSFLAFAVVFPRLCIIIIITRYPPPLSLLHLLLRFRRSQRMKSCVYRSSEESVGVWDGG